MDVRYTLLESWLKNSLHDEISLSTLAGDASFRRYFRVKDKHGKSFVAMDAPPTHEDLLPFIRVAEKLHQKGIQAPTIFQKNLEDGFLLLSDLGNDLFLPLLNPSSVETLYGQAIHTLHQIQLCDTQTLPRFDEALILREFSLFVEWFLQKHLNLSLKSNDFELLNSVQRILQHVMLEQPQCFVHRDYHSRNLLSLDKQGVGVIDFQDAVQGPITYDLISLIRDCYIQWPETQVEKWIAQFYETAKSRDQLQEISFDTFKRWADLQSIQRHLKAIGIFSRLNYRDNKANYLNDIPRTLQYVLNLSGQYPELLPFHHWLSEKLT